MNTHDFIFSNRPHYRLSRHTIFWLLWFVFVLMAYHVPTAVFPGWNIKARMDYATERFGIDYVTLRGGWSQMIWEITYRQSWILACYIAFTYTVIYYITPMYHSKKKNWIATTGILILLIITFLGITYFITYLTVLDSVETKVNRGIPDSMPATSAIISRTIGPATFNLTTLVVLAVTIKQLKRWWLKQKETELIAKEKASAELQLLKAQIHPHFLFNSINNIYSFTLGASPKAPEMIQKLSDLLYYMIYDCKQALVPLEKELKMIQDYISLEKIRYGQRLYLEININETPLTATKVENKMIAPLLLIPFVENSFKHGTSKMLADPRVTLNIAIRDNFLFFELINSKPRVMSEQSVNGNSGLGLKNVQKRLALLYPGRHELQMQEGPAEYSVWLKILFEKQVVKTNKTSIKPEETLYELA